MYELNILYKVCVFRTDRKIKMAALALIGWNYTSRLELLNEIGRNLTGSKYSWSYPLPRLRLSPIENKDDRTAFQLTEAFSTPTLQPLNGIWQILTVRKYSTSFTKFVYFVRSENKLLRWYPGVWLNETFSNRIWRNFSGSKYLTSSTKFVFFRPIGKQRWPPWPLTCWDIFDFFSWTAEYYPSFSQSPFSNSLLSYQNI